MFSDGERVKIEKAVELAVTRAVERAFRPLQKKVDAVSLGLRSLQGAVCNRSSALGELNDTLSGVHSQSVAHNRPHNFQTATERWSVTIPERRRLGYMG